MSGVSRMIYSQCRKGKKKKTKTSTTSTVPSKVVLQKWKDEDIPPQIKAREVHHH